jgi:hypothetical protein
MIQEPVLSLFEIYRCLVCCCVFADLIFRIRIGRVIAMQSENQITLLTAQGDTPWINHFVGCCL